VATREKIKVGMCAPLSLCLSRCSLSSAERYRHHNESTCNTKRMLGPSLAVHIIARACLVGLISVGYGSIAAGPAAILVEPARRFDVAEPTLSVSVRSAAGPACQRGFDIAVECSQRAVAAPPCHVTDRPRGHHQSLIEVAQLQRASVRTTI